MPRYADFEVVGKDNDGSLVCWDAVSKQPYNCGETLDEFGEHNLTPTELKRVG